MDFFVQLIVLGLIVPVAVGAALLAVGWQAWRPAGPAASSAWSTGWALAIGFAFCAAVVLGGLRLQPISTEEWVVWFALAAAVAGTVPQSLWRRWWFAWPVRGLLLAWMLWLTALPRIRYSWESPEVTAWFVGVVLGGLMLWHFLDRLERRLPVAVFGFVLALPVGLTGALLAATGSAKLGQLAGVLGLLLGLLFVAGLFLRGRSPGAGPAALYCLVFGAMLLNGHWYNTYEIPGLTALLLAVTPLAGFFGLTPPLRHRPVWQRGLVAIVAAALVAGAALSLAFDIALGSGSAPASEYEDY